MWVWHVWGGCGGGTHGWVWVLKMLIWLARGVVKKMVDPLPSLFFSPDLTQVGNWTTIQMKHRVFPKVGALSAYEDMLDVSLCVTCRATCTMRALT